MILFKKGEGKREGRKRGSLPKINDLSFSLKNLGKKRSTCSQSKLKKEKKIKINDRGKIQCNKKLSLDKINFVLIVNI